MNQLAINLSSASGIPFYRQIVDQISQLIRTGQLAENTRIPSVRELANQVLVSLITVRRAYSDLEAAGLIIRKQGQGTFVAPKIETISKELASQKVKTLLSEAIFQAKQLGFHKDEIREHFLRQLDLSEGESNGK